MASTLPVPEELVEEILLHVPPDEPANLVRATLVCKAWQSIISDHDFLRRYRRFHGTPPLLGYIWNSYNQPFVRFIPTASGAASSPVLHHDCSSRKLPKALDCRHGRVLIQADDASGMMKKTLIVWDPITGSQQHLSMPAYPHISRLYNYAGAVLCAKDCCDHTDCHGGPFLVVLVGTIMDHVDSAGDTVLRLKTWACVYSSETRAWRTTAPGIVNHHQFVDDMRPSVLVGDALYFSTMSALRKKCSMVKYDLCKHELSVMDLPGEFQPILIKADDGGLGVAALVHNCIYMWSWQVGIEGVGCWVKYRVKELEDTLLPNGGLIKRDLICMAEGTNTIFICIGYRHIFTLDLKSKQVRKIGEKETSCDRPILPYMSFYTP